MSDDQEVQFEYLVKRVGSQETGSQKVRCGKASRGRYLLISMKSDIQSIFPPLSETTLNDQALIGIELINKKRTLVYCNYVYHNSKPALGQANGRNEKRIYFPHSLDDGQFFADDILIFKKVPDIDAYEYEALWLTPDDRELYLKADALLVGNSTYARISGRISWFEAFNENREERRVVEIDQKVIDKVCDGAMEAEKRAGGNSPTSGMTAFASLFTSVSFRDFVMNTYGNNCAVTQEIISSHGFNNLEAAHIYPKCHGGEFLPTNGIALRRDIHWAFDKGMFCVEDDLTINVAEEVRNSYLGRYHGHKLKVVNEIFRPDPVYLKYHREHVFGLFRNTGSLKKGLEDVGN